MLTGGGAQLIGAADLAAHVFNLPVRVGMPLPVGGLVADYRSPAYSTAVGLILEGYDRSSKEGGIPGGDSRGREKTGPSVWEKLREWFDKEFF